MILMSETIHDGGYNDSDKSEEFHHRQVFGL